MNGHGIRAFPLNFAIASAFQNRNQSHPSGIFIGRMWEKFYEI